MKLSVLLNPFRAASPTTPAGLLIRALVLVVVFFGLHLCGLRSHTSVLCGSLAYGFVPSPWLLMPGLAYVFAWLGVTVAAPILLLAAGLLWLFNRFRKGRES